MAIPRLIACVVLYTSLGKLLFLSHGAVVHTTLRLTRCRYSLKSQLCNGARNANGYQTLA